MNILLNALVIHFLIIKTDAASTSLSPEERAREIARLEKQKSQLYQQLNAAINDSVRSLRASNDSEARVGISYIEDLREKVKALNASPSQYASGRAQTQEILDPEPDFRRDAENQLRQIVVPPMKYADAQLFEASKVFGDKKHNPVKWQQRYDNRVIMQKKLEDWLAQREREKTAIKRYKAIRGKEEKCPRFGVDKKTKKKKKDTRRQDGEAGGEGPGAVGGGGGGGGARRAGGSKYPCCRKCCKKSYLGCL